MLKAEAKCLRLKLRCAWECNFPFIRESRGNGKRFLVCNWNGNEVMGKGIAYFKPMKRIPIYAVPQ